MYKSRPASSRNDDAEFGLDLPSSQGPDISGRELSELNADPFVFGRTQLSTYGAISDNLKNEKRVNLAETGGKLYAGLHLVSAFAASLLLLYAFCHRVMYYAEVSKQLARSVSPSPAAPGVGLQLPTCAAYKYPQCEAAMQWYLSRNARNRCEAFELVKAEGDYFKFPYSEDYEDKCDLSQPGCCGCSGQCSKCPPLLAECFSWRFDGSWQIAFQDGSESRYTFDAHGHGEAEMSSSSLPVTWKSYDQAYMSQGSNILEQWLSVEEAQRLCHSEPRCKGFTYDESTLGGAGAGTYWVYMKSKPSIAPASGTGWKSYVQEEKPNLHSTVAIAGPLSHVSSEHAHVFWLDLHKAAPQLFPQGSKEMLTVTGDELRVERRYPGMKAQIGRGYRKRL